MASPLMKLVNVANEEAWDEIKISGIRCHC